MFSQFNANVMVLASFSVFFPLWDWKRSRGKCGKRFRFLGSMTKCVFKHVRIAYEFFPQRNIVIKLRTVFLVPRLFGTWIVYYCQHSLSHSQAYASSSFTLFPKANLKCGNICWIFQHDVESGRAYCNAGREKVSMLVSGAGRSKENAEWRSNMKMLFSIIWVTDLTFDILFRLVRVLEEWMTYKLGSGGSFFYVLHGCNDELYNHFFCLQRRFCCKDFPLEWILRNIMKLRNMS